MFKLKIPSLAALESALPEIVGLTAADNLDSMVAESFDAANSIVESVRTRGDAAVAEFTRRFDNVELDPGEFEVDSGEIEAATRQIDANLLSILRRAHDNVRRFHEMNLRQSWEERFEDGSAVGQRFTALDSAGVYVPGGTAFYPSSVLMNIAPAKVAGVHEIIMVSPPSFDGTIHPAVLAAAHVAGVTRVFRVGGAQAVAALAYGTERIPKVLKITGPGNMYVTAAKRVVQNVCAIDTEAGPSEVLVIADGQANPALVAAELLAQAEHDVEAKSILVTTSAALADAALARIDEELTKLSRAEIIRQSLDRHGAVIVVNDLETAVRVSNEVGPEHLAIYTEHPRQVLEGIRNAGSIMLGEATTVVLGDYYAGPNHILPTNRRARFASPLTADDFRKVSSIISFTPERSRNVADDVATFARAEALTAHARAMELRK